MVLAEIGHSHMRNRPQLNNRRHSSDMLPLIGGAYAGWARQVIARRSRENPPVVAKWPPLESACHMPRLSHEQLAGSGSHSKNRSSQYRCVDTENCHLSMHHGDLQLLCACIAIQCCRDRRLSLLRRKGRPYFERASIAGRRLAPCQKAFPIFLPAAFQRARQCGLNTWAAQ